MVSAVQMQKVQELLDQGYTPAQDVSAREFARSPGFTGPKYLRSPEGEVFEVGTGGDVKKYVEKTTAPKTDRRPPSPS